MTAASRNMDLIARAIAATDQLRTDLNSLRLHLQSGVEPASNAPSTPLETSLEAPLPRENVLAAHRRAHRRGTPAKIASDPEREAVIAARIQGPTFAEIVARVAAHFPPKRRISMSSLQRWWVKRRGATR